MDPVSASENFLQQVGQKLVRALFGGKKTEEKKQGATEEDGEPNVSAQGVETTAEVGETPVDPSNESAVSVQENRDDAPSTSPPGPDISERSHLGQTEHSFPQESKTKSSDSSQPTAADEEVTERRHGQDDQSTQVAVVSVEPLDSPDSRALQGDAGATKSDSLKQPNRSEQSAEELAPDVETEVLSCQDNVDWKENVQGELLHTDSQELQNAPEDTTVQDSAAPTPIKAKFMDKTEIQVQMQSENSSHGIPVEEKLSKDKTALTNHQESEESVYPTQSPGADSSESSLAADAGTVNIPLPTSCSEQPAGVKDSEKLVTQTGQLPECDSDTVDLGDTDKTAVESGVSCASKEITTSHGTMSEEVQPRPSLAANSDRPFPLDQEHQQSPNRDSQFSTSGVTTPDVQVDVKDAVALCTSTEKAVATETKATDIGMPVDTPGAEQETDVGDLQQRSSCLLEGTKTIDTAAPVNKPKSVQENGASENLEKSSCSQAMTEATGATMPVDTSQVVQEAPSNEPQEKPPCSFAGMKETDTAALKETPQSEQASGTGDLTEKPPLSLEGTETYLSVMTVDSPQVLQESLRDNFVEKPSCSQAGTRASDSVKSGVLPQVFPESGSKNIQEKLSCSQARMKEPNTDTPAYTPQAEQSSSHPQTAGMLQASATKGEVSNSAILDTPQSVAKPGGKKIRNKSSQIQAESEESHTAVSADTRQTVRDSGAGGVHEKYLLHQARTEETDTPTSVDTSQANPESDASTSPEKSPHSQADAKASESVMPAVPSYAQTITQEDDITMPVDTSEADQERGARKTSFQLDAVCSKLMAAEMNAKIMKSRLGRLFEALPSLSQMHDILRQLCGKLMGNRMLVLLGEAGSGKTTAAILLAHYAPVWCGVLFDSYLYYCDHEFLPESVTDFPSNSLIIIDNFLGWYDPDSLSHWNAMVPLLESMKENAHKQILLLLTSRTAIFQNLMSSEGADLRFFLDENLMTNITIDYGKMWNDICADVKLKTFDFKMSPSIGFPLCCQLAPHLAPDEQTILFQQPRLALRRMVRTLMDSNDAARTALTLLAVVEGSLDMNTFSSLPRLQASMYYEIIPQAACDEETSAQIIAFYRSSTFLFQVCNDSVSFRSEVIREAVLVELCDSHAELLAKYCSLELLSRIALATSDEDTSNDAEKPVLSESANSIFVRRLLAEMKNANNFDAMFSSFFQQHAVLSMFESTVKEERLLKQWTQKCRPSGLHFVFYAGAVPSVFRSALSELDKRNLWAVLQAVLACCYWGYNSEITALMKVWKNKTDLKEALQEATILDIVTGNLPGLSRNEEPQKEMAPLFPEDTLLVLAARRGNDAVVKTLANRDMNVNSQGMAGRTALMHYCARGRRQMVQFLLGKKADPMMQDKWGMTALMYALQQKEWVIPKELKTTENCRVVNTYLQSPLTFACANKWSTQMIKTFIDKGADFLQRDKWGYTCLHYACLHGHTDIVEYLLKEKKVDVRGKTAFGHTPFTLAVTGPDRSTLVKFLLQTEATKDAEDQRFTNMVCRASDCSVMKTLLSATHQKADVKNRTLREASAYGNTEMVQYLLLSGTNAAARNPSDWSTALHSACIGASVDCCEILLKKIEANVETKDGFTPLMTALQVGALDCARLLLRQGADLNASRGLGSCLHHATLSNLCSVLDWCIKEHKMDVNLRNAEGMTPLQLACRMGKDHSVKYLLENGADILNVDVDGDTCLHDAARGGHWDIIRLLQEKVDPSLMNAPNALGETPAQLLKTRAPTSQNASAE